MQDIAVSRFGLCHDASAKDSVLFRTAFARALAMCNSISIFLKIQ
jgi:hypothetical protein